MPTGYTHNVQDGTITDLRTFAMQCARAFGALITMRDAPSDAPIPDRFEPNTKHHDDKIADAEVLVASLMAMTPDECIAAASADYQQKLEEHQQRAARRRLHKDRYDDMAAQVTAWQPPEAVQGLRSFMLEQLQTSIDHDCNGSYDEAPTKKSGSEWYAAALKEARWDLDYHMKARGEEIASVSDRNHWLNALRVSLVQL